MKIYELKQIIRECIEEVYLQEKAPHRPRIVTQSNGNTRGHPSDTYYADRANTQNRFTGTGVGGQKVEKSDLQKGGQRKGMLSKSEIKRRKERYQEMPNRAPADTSYVNSQGKRVSSPRKSSYKKSGVGK